MTTKPHQFECSSIIEAMHAHIDEHSEDILSKRSGQIILDYSRHQVAFKMVNKAGLKKVVSDERKTYQ